MTDGSSIDGLHFKPFHSKCPKKSNSAKLQSQRPKENAITHPIGSNTLTNSYYWSYSNLHIWQCWRSSWQNCPRWIMWRLRWNEEPLPSWRPIVGYALLTADLLEKTKLLFAIPVYDWVLLIRCLLLFVAVCFAANSLQCYNWLSLKRQSYEAEGGERGRGERRERIGVGDKII